jgi:hypothetical protein
VVVLGVTTCVGPVGGSFPHVAASAGDAASDVAASGVPASTGEAVLLDDELHPAMEAKARVNELAANTKHDRMKSPW